MDKNLRKPFIAGNWKMNKTPSETVSLINELIPLINEKSCDIALCVPFVDIPNAIKLTENTNIKIGAQNCHFEKSGAFTGEISASMLKDLGVEYVIIGHSERRTYFAETDETVNKKVVAAINVGLKVILCIGESLEQKEQNITFEVISKEIKIALKGVEKSNLEKITIAYEPIWAIGTGKTATATEANEVCKFIRSLIEKLYDKDAASKIVIQYGGSMNAKNARELLQQPNIDGGLIGGATLKPVDFSKIIKATH